MTTDGVEIAYDVEGSGPPLLLVHGITEDRLLWRPVVDRLAPDFRCISVDLRGHGESGTAADYDALAMAQDLTAVAAAETAQESPACIGHSLGAMVATVLAAGGGARAVVNVDQGLRLADLAAALRPLEAPLRAGEVASTMVALGEALGDGVLPHGVRAEVRRRHEQARGDVVLGVWSTVFASTDDELMAVVEQTLLPNVQVPYLALHGSDPGPGYEAWLTGLVPTALVEVWEGSGHWLHLLDPDRFARRVRDFLRPGGSVGAR